MTSATARLSHATVFRALSLVGAALVAGCSASSGKPPALAPPEASVAWTAFASEEGGFHADFPGAPEMKRHDHPETPGASFRLRGNRVEMFVSYVDFVGLAAVPENRRDLLMDTGRDAGLRQTGGTVLEERPRDLEGHAGRAFRVDFHDGSQGSMLTVIVGARVYQVGVVGDASKLATKDVGRFLEGFKLAPALRPFAPEGSGYRAMVPVVDDASGAEIDDGGSPPGRLYRFTRRTGKEVTTFVVGEVARPGSPNTDEGALYGGLFASMMGGVPNVKDQRLVTHGGLSGQEAIGARGPIHLRARAFAVGKRLLQLYVMASRPEELTSGEAEAFFRGFSAR